MFEPWPDFDEMLVLAKTNPQKLDDLLKAKVDRLIDSAPTRIQNRLRGIQFEVDCQRKINKSSYEACRKISEMMHDSLMELNRVLNNYSENRSHGSEQSESAKVIELRAAT